MDEQTNLIETLRFCATNGDCRDCPCDFQCEGTMGNGLYTRAADALEQESKRADELGDELTAAMDLVHKRDEKIAQLKADLLAKDKNVPDKKIGDWISVEERLPEKHKAVLFYIPWNKSNMIGWYTEDGNINFVGYGKCYDFSLVKPSHWTPLPKPPKEVNDEV